MSKIWIGTSGFNYKHWSNGVFYPEGLKERLWLEFYAGKFNTVELNVSFYRLPKRETFEDWEKRTPKEFCFAIKGSRYITHAKRLIEPEIALNRFSQAVSGLSNKAGIVLWQFPESFRLDVNRLDDFCGLIKKDIFLNNIPQAFEFRNHSWFVEEVFGILRKNNFTLCIADSPVWPINKTITANYVYLRFHGGKSLYGSEYSKKELISWSRQINAWEKQGLDIFAYFNNDAFGYAPKNALYLRESLS